MCGELRKLGLTASASMVGRLLSAAGVGPAPRCSGPTWRQFLGSQAPSILACAFFTVETAFLRRYYVMFFFELVQLAQSRRESERRLVPQQRAISGLPRPWATSGS
jgi:hypothetical protein